MLAPKLAAMRIDELKLQLMSCHIAARRVGRTTSTALLSVLISAVHPLACAAGGGNPDSLSLIDAYHRSADPAGSSPTATYSDLTVNTPGATNRLFTTVAEAGKTSSVSQTGKDNTVSVDQNGKAAVLAGVQSGADNRMTGTQGDLAMLRVSQRGDQNVIQALQAGRDDRATIEQSGAYNLVTGAQTGSGERAVVIQTGTHQTAVYAQSGTGAVLSIRQH
ncbi:hypothetical protein MKK69_17860 [Methylobacterium sp. J-026]|uniref:hypothetical protein n=1 Tax=Methylobacterium sp. J-026 TaxID=2836624 RepID=UPI001FBA4F20|nr:hypothetical protein [Methylobacterium sp. J-026]MCJ2135895.1 hypothetical protein [Methylobacterium sp. J-026]